MEITDKEYIAKRVEEIVAQELSIVKLKKFFKTDPVNKILSLAILFLSSEQLVSLRDSLIERTPKNESESNDTAIVNKIMEIDFMGTKEFCEVYHYPVPYYTGDAVSSATLFMIVDAQRLKEVMNYAKGVRRKQIIPEKK